MAATPDTVRTIGLGMVDRPNRKATSSEAVRAQEIRKNLDEAQRNKHAESPLQALKNNQDALDRTKSDQVISSTFDDTLDVSLSAGSSTGKERIDRAADARDTAEAYLDVKGYPKLTDVQKDVVRPQLKDVIGKQPWGSEIIARYSNPKDPNDVKALNSFLDRWAEDSDFRQTLRDVKREIIGNPPDVATLQTAIDSAVTLESQKDQAITEKGAEIITNSADQTKAQGELDDFGKDELDPSGTVIKISQQKEMDALKGTFDKNKSQYDKDLADFNTIVGSTYEGRWDPHHGLVIDPVDRATLLASAQWAAIKPLQDRMIAHEANEISYQGFADRKASLEARVATTQSEGDKIDAELMALIVDRGAADADIQTAKIDRAQAEQDYADRLTNVFSESMEKYMAEREGYMDAAQQVRLITEADREPDSMKKALKFANANYWGCHSIDKDGKLVDNVNKANVLDCLNLLTAEDSLDAALYFVNPATGNMYTFEEVSAEFMANPKFPDQFGTGPDAVMRQLTMSQINLDTGEYYTLAEVNAKLATDPEFFSKDQGDVVTNLIRKGVLGKQIKGDMTQRIINTPGLGGEKLLKGILESPEVKAMYEKKGYTTVGLLAEAKKHPTLSLWMLLMLLSPGLGVVVGAGVLTTRIVKSEAKGVGKRGGKEPTPIRATAPVEAAAA